MPVGENTNIVGYLDKIVDDDICGQIEPAPLPDLRLCSRTREPDITLADLRMHSRHLDLHCPLHH
jgi:hypothetical protein